MKVLQIIVSALVFASSSVLAQTASTQASPVELVGDVKLIKVTEEGGEKKETLVDPKVVVPGDRLIFSTRYRNTGKLPVNNFVVTNPLPGAVMLSPDGADRQVVSVDGGKTWGPLAGQQVDDGQGGKRAAVPADVTHLRWTLPLLQPGATGALTYHAIVR